MFLVNQKSVVNKTVILLVLITLGVESIAQQSVLKSQAVNSKTNAKVNSTVPKNQPQVQNNKPALSLEKINVSESEISTEKVIIVNKTAPLGVDVNYLPLFGGFEKNENQLVEDQLFLSDCDGNFKSRKEACEFFTKMGWDYLAEGDKNTATNRFNLAYLLDHRNIESYWGLGVIEFQNSNYSSSIRLMTKGLELDNNQNYVLMVDLATVYIKTALPNSNSMIEINHARNLLEKAISIQSNYSSAYTQLAVVYLFENNPDEAWNQFHKAYELNPAELNREILAELLSRKEDPKGVFKK